MTVFVGDPGLLQSFRDGDREALERVYRHYVATVEFLLRRYIAAGTAASPARGFALRAELADLVQEVFLKAFSEPARRAYDGVREYRPYLVTLSRNVLLDHVRRRRREVQMDVATLERLGDREPPELPEDLPWGDARTMALVEAYLHQLPPNERAVYVMRYVKCRPQVEAATTLGLTRQQLRTAEVRLRRGLERVLARAELLVPGTAAPDAASQSSPVGVVPERNR